MPTVLTGLPVAGIATARSGGDGLLGAAFGTVLVVVFFSAGLLLSRRTAHRDPVLVTALAILSFLAKVAVLGGVLVLFRDTDRFDTRAFAAAVLCGTLVWLAAQVWAFTRVEILYVDPRPSDRP